MIIFLFTESLLTKLMEELRTSRRAAFAEGTRKNLHTQWKSFIMFCLYFGFNIMPASSTTLSLYIQFLARSFKSVQSIQNYVSGVKLMHILANAPCPQFDAVELKLAIRGMKRVKKHTPKQALPITPDILLKIKQTIDISLPVQAVFWAISILAFFTMARKSNLVPLTPSTFDKDKQLTRRDIILDDDCLLVRIKWSKTNQFSQKILYVPLMAMPESSLCPVAAYKNMVSLLPGQGVKPAFFILKSGKQQPFLYKHFQSMIKTSVEKIGLQPHSYSSHSFRRGGATTAFRAKVPPELIQLQGDWASDAYKRYLHYDLKDRALVSNNLRKYISTIELNNVS